MNVMGAMEDTMTLLESKRVMAINGHPALDHLIEMRNKMRDGDMSIGKLNRWLGWMQGTICAFGYATLDEMKDINKLHRIGKGMLP